MAASRVAHLALEGDLEVDVAGDTVDGEVAGDDAGVAPPGDRGAAEGRLGEAGHVEQLVGAQVVVPGRVAGLDTGHPDGDVDRGVVEVLGDVDARPVRR